MQSALEVLGGKWTFMIIYSLLDGKLRFKELERAVVGINTRMLVKEVNGATIPSWSARLLVIGAITIRFFKTKSASLFFSKSFISRLYILK